MTSQNTVESPEAEEGPAQDDAPSRQPRRGRLQFGVRSLLVLITVTAILLGIRQPAVRKYRHQMGIVEELKGLGATVQLEPIRPAPLRWLVADNRLYRVTMVRLRNCPLPEDGLKKLVDLPDLERLYLAGTPVTDDDLEHVAKLSELRRLSLWKTRITDRGIEHLASLEKLELLDIHRTGVTDAALEHLEALPELRQIITTMTLTERGLDSLTRFAHYPRVIRGSVMAEGLTDRGMARLTRLREITNLRLRYSEVSPYTFGLLLALSKMKRIELANTTCDDRGLAYLRQMPGLEEINIAGASKISLGGITRQWGPQMRTVNLTVTRQWCNISCSGNEMPRLNIHFWIADMESLAACPNVESMYLASTELNEEVVTALGEMGSLKNLQIIYSHRTHGRGQRISPPLDLGNTSQHLAGLTQLERLTIQFWSLTDEQLEFLGDFPSLRYLTLQGAQVTGSVFAAIRDKCRLKSVQVIQCPHFGEEGLAHLLELSDLESADIRQTGVSKEAGEAMARRMGKANVRIR